MPRSTPYWRIFHITNTRSSVSTSQSRQKVLIVTNRMDPTYVPTLAQGSTLKESHFLATSRLLGRMSSTKIRWYCVDATQTPRSRRALSRAGSWIIGRTLPVDRRAHFRAESWRCAVAQGLYKPPRIASSATCCAGYNYAQKWFHLGH